MRLALYQPDIALNVGSAMRLCACLGIGLDVIEPCGFPWDKKKIRSSAMDYFDHVDLNKYISWEAYHAQRTGRIVLMTTKASVPYTDFEFHTDDILLAGRESAGVPDNVHETVDGRVLIPMHAGLRSLNIVNASAMILGEALRQTDGFGTRTTK